MSKIRIEGDLIANAQSMVYTDGTAVAVLHIGQPGGDPIVVERCYGNSASAQFACSKAASQMRKGCHVVAHGLRLKPARLHGEKVIRLEGVDHVEHPSGPQFHEPAAQAA